SEDEDNDDDGDDEGDDDDDSSDGDDGGYGGDGDDDSGDDNEDHSPSDNEPLQIEPLDAPSAHEVGSMAMIVYEPPSQSENYDIMDSICFDIQHQDEEVVVQDEVLDE
ncbi:MAG TPA: hypothetical protein VIJ14_06865, partial [Rhabdochlamydiaceae bacterium]